MKQKTITTDKATLLVVEFPEGAEIESALFVNNYGRYIRWWNKGKDYLVDLPDDEGNWQLLGRLPDITEEQWKCVVDFHDKPEGYFRNYIYHTIQAPHIWKKSATDSGISLLQANEIYFENPIPPFKECFEDFKESQSKVWDKERCYIFIKVD